MRVVVVDVAPAEGIGRGQGTLDAAEIADEIVGVGIEVATTVQEPAGLGDVGDGAAALVAVGPASLRACALADADLPVVPVATGASRHTVPRRALAGAMAAVRDGEAVTRAHPVLGLAIDDELVGRAALDATLMTASPAKISEYAVGCEGEALGTVRSDGVVVATPVGSGAYARSAGGPVVGHGAGLALVPVAPFTTRSTPWVVDGAVTVSVERDDSAVTLFADDRSVRTLRAGETVSVDVAGAVTLSHVRAEHAT